jgi:hypothetical protein
LAGVEIINNIKLRFLKSEMENYSDIKYTPRQQQEIVNALNAYEEFITSCFSEMDFEPDPLRFEASLKRYHEIVPKDIPLPDLIKSIDEKLGVKS